MSEEGGFNKITIIGVGLIGGSIGLTLKTAGLKNKIVGVDNLSTIEKAMRLGAIDEGTDKLLIGIQNADLIILATPISSILKLLSEIAPHLKTNCLVTDTGSVKAEIVEMANRILPAHVDFIGGHPMAGSEKSGIDAASEQLFKGKPFILVPLKKTKKNTLKTMIEIIELLGAFVLVMDAGEHDRIAAAVSHLPQLLSVSLVNLSGFLAEKENNENFYYAFGSAFADMTRIAASTFDIWKDIYTTNNEIVIEMIEKFKDNLDKMVEKLKNNPNDLEEDFMRANQLKKCYSRDMDVIKKQND